MQRVPIRVVLALLALLLTSAAPARQLSLQSPPQRVSLLELYTSEGCSSCPPADRWLSNLKNDPRLWKQVVPIAFHVDYWDYIGWPDRFATKAAGQRQQAYARHRRIGSVYTPGLVVAGKEWRGWFSRPVLNLGKAREVGRLRLQVNGPDLNGEFESRHNHTAKLVLHVARLGFGLRTRVRAGENEGRELEHDFVVLGYRIYPMTGQGLRYQVQGRLPGSSQQAPREALATWVSVAGDPYPIQAAGGWLPE